MLLMRRRDEAEGDSKIIGSGRRPGFLGGAPIAALMYGLVGAVEG